MRKARKRLICSVSYGEYRFGFLGNKFINSNCLKNCMGVLEKSINNLYAGVFGTTCSFRKMSSKLRSATKTSLTLLGFFPPIHGQKSHRTMFKTEVDYGIQALQRNK